MRNFLNAVCGPLVSFMGRLWMRLFGCSVDGSAKIYGLPSLWMNRGKVTIGARTVIGSLPFMYGFGQEFSRCTFTALPAGRIEIGDDVCIVGSAFWASERIEIGDRVLIAAGCRIADVGFHPVDAVPRRYKTDMDGSPVHIEDDVWLCAEVMVCKGVRIGRGSVIGAKSVVTRDIPPMVFAAGNPATVIRPLSQQASD